MRLRTRAAIVAGKASALLLRSAGRGGGALPGLIAQKVSPSILGDLAASCDKNLILVCGTNGKTTVSRLLADMLPQAVHNRSGSNMLRGHIAAFLDASSWNGSVAGGQAILEVDEAVVPAVLKEVKPTVVILHNLFRDQLDRYGEVDSIAKKWLEALKRDLPAACTLLINGDDPNLAYSGSQLPGKKVRYYGLDDPSAGTKEPIGTVDAYLSPADGKPLSYKRYYLSHLGEYAGRPDLDFAARHIAVGTDETPSSFEVGSAAYTLPLPGLYSLYNGLAALAAGISAGIPAAAIQTSLKNARGAFGRYERIQVGETELVFCLIKNPTGATEVLKTVAASEGPFGLAFLMHDNFADGLDVSWYWDTSYEIVAGRPASLVCAGIRAEDIALRLKYAGLSGAQVMRGLAPALDAALASKLPRFYVLCTYTATLELQGILTSRGLKSAYWQE